MTLSFILLVSRVWVYIYIYMCIYMCVCVCLCVCVCVCVWHYVGGTPSRRSPCLFWRETQTKGLNSRSPTRPEVEVERKVREKTGVSWRRKTQRCSRQRGAEETSRQLTMQGREWQSQQKSERRLLRPDELRRGRVNQREKMSALLVPFCRRFTQNTIQH